jgi:hypothetical protein
LALMITYLSSSASVTLSANQWFKPPAFRPLATQSALVPSE